MIKKLVRGILIDILAKRENVYPWRGEQPLLDVAALGNVFIFHTDGKLGDAVVHSPLLALIKKRNRSVKLVLITTLGVSDYWKSHPLADETIILNDRGTGLINLWRSLQLLKGLTPKPDLAISLDTFMHLDHVLMLRAVNAPKVLGFNRDIYRLFTYSLPDVAYSICRKHISGRLNSVAELIGLDVQEIGAPYVGYAERDGLRAETIIPTEEAASFVIFINAYGSSQDKIFSPPHLRQLCSFLLLTIPAAKIYLNIAEGYEVIRDARESKDTLLDPIHILPRLSLGELFAVVARADAVITPDTSIAHIAAAMGKPLVCLYPEQLYSPAVWHPQGKKTSLLIANASSINSIHPELIVSSLMEQLRVR